MKKPSLQSFYYRQIACGNFTCLTLIDTLSRIRLYHDIISYDGEMFVDYAFIKQMPCCNN